MKKIRGVLLIMTLVAFMTACGNNAPSGNGDTANRSGNTLPENAVILDAGEWPDNAYTANIPQPKTGVVLRGWIDPVKEYCYIVLSGMTQAQSEQYVNALIEAGFSEVESVSEEIGDDYFSTGILLTNGRATLSIAYGDDSFGMYIKNNQ